jgi:hypothetical protein
MFSGGESHLAVREARRRSNQSMGHAVRTTMVIMLAAVAIHVDPASCSSESSAGWVASVQDAQTGQNALEAGIDAYREGALEVAVEALSNALGESLTDKQRADALYFRGLAYRELGIPGQAVLDLTSAISLKNGLSKARLKDAARQRDGATREAGIGPAASVIADDASVNDSRTAVPVPAGRVPVPREQPREWTPLTTSSISTGQPPPTPHGGFISAVEQLIPDWP